MLACGGNKEMDESFGDIYIYIYMGTLVVFVVIDPWVIYADHHHHNGNCENNGGGGGGANVL